MRFIAGLLLPIFGLSVMAFGEQRVTGLRAVWPRPSCAATLSAELRRERSRSEIEGLIRNLAVLDIFSWILRPSLQPETTEVFNELAEFTPRERQIALDALNRRVEVPEVDAGFYLKLALNDRQAWLWFIDNELMTEGDPNGILSHGLKQTLAKMPQPLRGEILKRAGALYTTAEKQAPADEARGRTSILGPKRALDVLINSLLPPRALIAKAVDAGKSSLDAYGEWIQQIRQVLPLNTYNHNSVLRVLNEIKKFLKEKGTLEPVTVYGSLIGGRAKAESDLDTSVQDPELESWDWETLLTKINQIFLAEGTPLQLREVSTHVAAQTRDNFSEVSDSILIFSDEAAAAITPVQFRVTARQITMRVYDPFFRGNRYDLGETGVKFDSYMIQLDP